MSNMKKLYPWPERGISVSSSDMAEICGKDKRTTSIYLRKFSTVQEAFDYLEKSRSPREVLHHWPERGIDITIKELAEMIGIHKRDIHYAVTKCGGDIGKAVYWLSVKEPKTKKIICNGKSVRQLSSEAGCAIATMRKHIAKYGRPWSRVVIKEISPIEHKKTAVTFERKSKKPKPVNKDHIAKCPRCETEYSIRGWYPGYEGRTVRKYCDNCKIISGKISITMMGI